jgi:hypothetical protein
LAVQHWQNTSSEDIAEGLQDSILRIAEVRFPAINPSLNDKLRSINVLEVLYGLVDAVTEQQGDLAAFERTLDATLQMADDK